MNKSKVKQYFFNLFDCFPYGYKIAKKYVNYHEGINNSDFRTNGELFVLSRLIKYCDVIFDAGAFLGNWSLMCFKLKTDIHIHMFEPFKNSFNELKKKFHDNNRIILNNVALGNSEGKGELYINETVPSLNSVYQRKDLCAKYLEHNRKEPIIVTTLDTYCDQKIQKIDYIKIDTEGNELNILEGGKKLIENRSIKFIQFEYGGCNIESKTYFKDIYKFLRDYNYYVYKIYPKKIMFIDKYHTGLDNFQLQNFIASREQINI